MELYPDIAIKDYTTFRMGGTVAYLVVAHSLEDITEALVFAREKELQYTILGGGSNIIFPDEGGVPVVVIKIAISGIDLHDMGESVSITVGAGVAWDDFVLYCVEHGFSGVEMLSAIPGTVGATPVQNVGAYGGEVGNHITQVHAYDTTTQTEVLLSTQDCKFAYRDSIFKQEKNRYIILSVVFQLKKILDTLPIVPNYPGVAEFFQSRNITQPTLMDIRNAITEIRWAKLPDPKVLASCGSFFKNPIVETSIAGKIKNEFPKAVVHDVGGGMSKIGAGWLIDTLGLKGQTFGNLSIYEKNALVLVNNGDATKKELVELITYIQKLTFDRFGIYLEPEPVFI